MGLVMMSDAFTVNFCNLVFRAVNLPRNGVYASERSSHGGAGKTAQG
jgi:hypothetical protein